jgi:hypothetical protein
LDIYALLKRSHMESASPLICWSGCAYLFNVGLHSKFTLGISSGSRGGALGRGFPVVLGAVICALVFPALALAHSETVRDGNDRPGPLDIRTVSLSHARDSIRYTINMFSPWRTSVISEERTPLNYVAVGFDLRGDSSFERFAILLERKGGLRGFFIAPGRRILRPLASSRPNRRSVSVLVPRDLLDDPGTYYWAALSDFHRSGRHHTDWIPNRETLLHDLVAPVINLHSPLQTISTFYSATTTFPIGFNINDPGRSAGVDWHLERRLLGSAKWETDDSGEGEGPHTAEASGEEGGNYFLRVVARDRHGNMSKSSAWSVSVPLDDANAAFSGAYSGAWTTTPEGAPFQGTLHSTSTVDSAFTYTFTVTHPDTRIAWIGPGTPGGGMAAVSLDGLPPVIAQQHDTDVDRQVVWEGSDPALGTHTIVIANVSGTIAIDGLVIR